MIRTFVHALSACLPPPAHTHRLRLLALGLGLALGTAGPARAQATITAEAGLGGRFRSHAWLPVSLQLTNQGAPAKVQVRARFATGGDGVQDFRLAERTLQGNANELHTLYLRAPVSYGQQQLIIEFLKDGRVINTLRPSLQVVQSYDRLVVGIGSPEFTSAVNLMSTIRLTTAELTAGGMRRGGVPGNTQGSVAVAPMAPDRVPDRWQGLQAADLVVLGPVSERDFRPEQLTALRDYVLSGGTLVAVGGVNWNRLTAPYFRQLLPVTATGAGTASGRISLGEGLNLSSTSPVPYTRVQPQPGITESEGRLGEGPARISARLGAGTIVFLPFDPTTPPFREWTGTAAFWKRELLAPAAPALVPQLTSAGPDPWSSNAGGLAVNQRLADAPYAIPQLDIPSFYVVALFLLAYIIVLVPVNYFVLKARDKKEYAWLTTPAIVLVFSVGAYLIGYGFKGGRTLVVKVGVLEARTGQDAAPGIFYAGLFSPAKRGYDLREAPSTAPAAGLDGGSTLFSDPAMDVRGPGLRLIQEDAQRVDDFAVDMWAMRVIRAENMARLGKGFTARLKREGGRLTGTLGNNSPYSLEDCSIISGTEVRDLGDLPAGGSLTLEVRQPGSGALGGTLPGALITRQLGNSEQARIRRAVLQPLSTAGNFGSLSDGPVLVGWIKDPVAPIMVDGRRPRELAATLLLLHLD